MAANKPLADIFLSKISPFISFLRNAKLIFQIFEPSDNSETLISRCTEYGREKTCRERNGNMEER